MSTYLYAVVAADHPVRLDDLKSVGETDRSPRVLTAGPLKAVVSEAPEGLRAKRRDLLCHQTVLERLSEDGTALPMRFGLVAPDETSVLSALEENASAYQEALARLEGCVEYNLKASRREEDLLREVMDSSEEARRLNRRTREDPGALDDRVALGELVAREVRQRQEHEARRILDALAPAAVRHAVGEPTEEHFLNVSFLVRRTEAPEFTRLVGSESEQRGSAYDFTLSGPLPPYSFV